MEPRPELSAHIHVPLRDFALDVALVAQRGSPLALVGASGAGKTSVLASVAGLMRPSAGRIAVGDDCWFDADRGVDVPTDRRPVGMVFQDYALFPHMTVARNVAYGGQVRAAEMMRLTGIAHLADARPGQLSGGERQRVALARALARQPAVLLLDEPLSALDEGTRADVRARLAQVIATLDIPVLLVTHDMADAAALGARIAVLNEGQVVQEGTREELLARPGAPAVARLIGANLLPGTARAGPAGLTEVVLDAGGSVLSGEPGRGRVGVVIDPWEVSLLHGRADDSQQNHIVGTVGALTPVGNRVRVQVGPVVADITALSAARMGLAVGTPVTAVFKALATRLVPMEA